MRCLGGQAGLALLSADLWANELAAVSQPSVDGISAGLSGGAARHQRMSFLAFGSRGRHCPIPERRAASHGNDDRSFSPATKVYPAPDRAVIF